MLRFGDVGPWKAPFHVGYAAWRSNAFGHWTPRGTDLAGADMHANP